MVENDRMNEDQAWPQGADFRAGGGFYELVARSQDALVAMIPLLLLMGPRFVKASPAEICWWLPVLLALPLALVWLWFPSQYLFRRQARLFSKGSSPLTHQPESLLTPRQERRDLWAFLLVLGLALVTGLAANLHLLLLFFPLVVFRLVSRLWAEVDLLGGRVYYHRTFLGLQISRNGPSLEEAIGIVSGLKIDRPGEDPVFSVCAILPGQDPIALDSMSRHREESHALGRRLGLQLNLPHESMDYEVDPNQLRGPELFRARTRWKPLALKENPPVRGGKLPPLGPA